VAEEKPVPLAEQIAWIRRRAKDAAESPNVWAWETTETKTRYHRAILATLEAAQWRPIETAPKDGSTVLLYFADHSLAYPMIGTGFWDGVTGQWWNKAWNEATHWMPLPDPPATAATEEKP
jgi:hypothetical protein